MYERRRRTPARVAHSAVLCHVEEGPIALVAIEFVDAEVRDVEVGIAVAIVVTDRRAHAESPVTGPRGLGDVGETNRPMVVVSGQLVSKEAIARKLGIVAGGDQVHVEVPVEVVVDPGTA